MTSRQACARLGVYSLRKIDRHVCRCLGYEFEDSIAEFDEVQLYLPEIEAKPPTPVDWKLSRILNRVTRKKFAWRPAERIQHCGEFLDHELFFVFCQNVNDIRRLEAFPNWQQRSERTACWIDELWLATAKLYPKTLKMLNGFDYVFVSFRDTAEFLQSRGFNAHHIPAGIDALRFCPLPSDLERTIDVLAMGRKASATHRELFRLAECDKINYFFDTSSLPNVESFVEHRILMAKQIARSRFFFVQRAKADCPEQTQGQIEVGSRYFEGCAAGAILVGEKLDIPTFDEQFGWEDAVIPMEYNSKDISPILDILNGDPEYMNEIHRRNMRHSLLKHDWAYRWKQMLEIMGIEPMAAVTKRMQRLREMAYSIPADSNQRTGVA